MKFTKGAHVTLMLFLFNFHTSLQLGDRIKIATIAPADNIRLFSIQRIQPALEIGIEKIKEMDLVGGREISIQFANSNCSIEIGMNMAIEFFVAKEVDVFFGPICDYAAAPIGRQVKFWNIPMITPGAMARDYAVLKSNCYTLTTRIGSSVNSLNQFLRDLLRIYNWHKMKILYDPNGQDHLMERYCHIVTDGVHYGLDIKPQYSKFDKKEEIDTLLEAAIGAEYAIVVLCASADSVRDIMIKAHELNFDNGEYVFLNIDLFSSKNESERPWYREGEPERNEKAKKAYEALMTVTLRKPTSPAYKNFSEDVKRRAKLKDENFTYGEDEVNSFVGAFHDAVLLYALALNETLADNNSITNGTAITKRMWNRTFEGITGTVSIDENGDRNADYSLLDMNPRTGKFQVVANYFGKDKKYLPTKQPIHWAGGRTSPPPDTPKCGFDGAKCPPEEPFPEYGIVIIVLGSLLLIVLVAAFFIYRHIKLAAELAEMNWRVRWEDIMFGTMENDSKMRRQGSNISLTRTNNGEACAEGRVLIEYGEQLDQEWCKCGHCEDTDRIKRVCCRQLELFGIFKEEGTCITSSKEFHDVVLNKQVLLAVFIHVMLVRRQRGAAPIDLSSCKLRLMAHRQFLCWMHRGQKLKKESRMTLPSCVSRVIRTTFPDEVGKETQSRSSFTTTSITEMMPMESTDT